MAKPNSYCFSLLSILLLFTCTCSARQLPREPSELYECQLDTIDAREPDNRYDSEAGFTETWDPTQPDLRCAGVSVLKRTIDPNGLLLPSYVAYPELHFVEQGMGVLGMAIPGCAETYEEPQWERRGRPQLQQDRHQKVRYVKQGDIIAIPPGVPYWTYNYGNTPLVIVSLLDTSNKLNQLDRVPRRFYLGGNPLTQSGRKHGDEEESNNMFSGFDSRFLGEVLKVKERIIRKLQSPDGGQGKHQIIHVKGGLSLIRPPLEPEIRSEEERTHRKREEKVVEEEEVVEDESGKPEREHREWRKETRRHKEGESKGEEGEMVKEKETKTEEHHRHHGERERSEHGGEIREEEEEETEKEKQRRTKTKEREGQKDNFLEETVCTLKLHENLADSSRADVFNPRAGRITSVNGLTLPVLRLLHLSAQWVKLYKDGIFVPHWNMNANSVLYVTRGRGRVQVVNSEGKSVFNGEVRRGKLLVVPQNFAVAEQAGNEGLEYVVFKTNDRAEVNTMVGRDSAISATPAEVLGHVFGLSPQEVNELKNNRNEGVLATPDSRIQDGFIKMV
ncbi:legumin J-like [Vicia villosa]|uniref:legumin J-like n=1 Tax=Vicia villosa TaxID=3911 RepID=UPI00273ADCCB|nr:legumin J-like [Vicia villosa]